MNRELTLSFRALCWTENFKALRPVNLEKACLYIADGQEKRIFIK
jgi:hypothetical protein